MTIQTRAALLAIATLIRDATVPNENTALRVGGYCYDLLDSMLLQSEMRAPTAKCVATTNVNPLSGLTTSADGITASADGVDVILLTGQSTASQNGPWVVAAGSWSRPSWFPTGGNAGGVLITVQQGTIHAESQWQCTTDDPSAVIGTNNLAWRRQGVGYYSSTLAIIGDLNYCTGQRFRVIAGAGSDFIWTIGASDRMQLLNSSELLLYRGGDPTTYNDFKTTATGFELSSVVAGGTANVYLSGTGTTAALGNSTVSATSSVIATAAGTVNLDVGANHALAITAAAQTFRIGANTVASLAAATSTWGNATNVTTADLAAATSLHGYVGANAAWTADANGHTWRGGPNQIASATALLCDWGHATNVATAQLSASASLNGYIGANAAWSATATGHTWRAGANQIAAANATTCTWGSATNVATSDLSASTTLHGYVGANAAWTANATGHSWKAGANDIVTANATTCTWGHATNVATADLAASTTLHGYVGANAAWTAGAAFHTWKLGAVAALNIIDTELKHYGSDVTNYTRLTTGAASSTFARITAAGTANAFLMATATEVHLGDSTNTQTMDFLAAAAADTFQWLKGAALQADLDDGGFTVYDSAAATAYVTIQHDSIVFSKANTGGMTLKAEDATSGNAGHLTIEAADSAYADTPGNLDLIVWGETGQVCPSLSLKVGGTVTAIEAKLYLTDGASPMLGFFGATPIVKPTIAAATAGDIIDILVALGLVIDGT